MPDDVEMGRNLAVDFLYHCQEKRATGVGILNAIASATIGCFALMKFDSHSDRMTEFDNFVADLRKAIDGNRGLH